MKEQLKNLDAKSARKKTYSSGDLENILNEIDRASGSGKRSLRIRKSKSNSVKAALEKRNFKIEDTGKIWHISWEIENKEK